MTHASNVIAAVKCNDAASGTVTNELDPLNDNADPYFPDPDQLVPDTVPAFPLPDASATAVPDPSLNEYAATNDDAADVPVPALEARAEEVVRVREHEVTRGTEVGAVEPVRW